MTNKARMAALLAIGFDHSVEFGARESLNVSEVRELRDLVDFQSHSVSHPILPECSAEKAAEEIALSKRQLEARLALRVNALAYPNGSYAARELQMTRESGYACGLTTQPGFNKPTTPPYK